MSPPPTLGARPTLRQLMTTAFWCNTVWRSHSFGLFHLSSWESLPINTTWEERLEHVLHQLAPDIDVRTSQMFHRFAAVADRLEKSIAKSPLLLEQCSSPLSSFYPTTAFRLPWHRDFFLCVLFDRLLWTLNDQVTPFPSVCRHPTARGAVIPTLADTQQLLSLAEDFCDTQTPPSPSSQPDFNIPSDLRRSYDYLSRSNAEKRLATFDLVVANFLFVTVVAVLGFNNWQSGHLDRVRQLIASSPESKEKSFLLKRLDHNDWGIRHLTPFAKFVAHSPINVLDVSLLGHSDDHPKLRDWLLHLGAHSDMSERRLVIERHVLGALATMLSAVTQPRSTPQFNGPIDLTPSLEQISGLSQHIRLSSSMLSHYTLSFATPLRLDRPGYSEIDMIDVDLTRETGSPSPISFSPFSGTAESHDTGLPPPKSDLGQVDERSPPSADIETDTVMTLVIVTQVSPFISLSLPLLVPVSGQYALSHLRNFLETVQASDVNKCHLLQPPVFTSWPTRSNSERDLFDGSVYVMIPPPESDNNQPVVFTLEYLYTIPDICAYASRDVYSQEADDHVPFETTSLTKSVNLVNRLTCHVTMSTPLQSLLHHRHLFAKYTICPQYCASLGTHSWWRVIVGGGILFTHQPTPETPDILHLHHDIGRWDYLVLDQGTELLFPPGQINVLFTLNDTIVECAYYYSRLHIRQSFLAALQSHRRGDPRLSDYPTQLGAQNILFRSLYSLWLCHESHLENTPIEYPPDLDRTQAGILVAWICYMPYFVNPFEGAIRNLVPCMQDDCAESFDENHKADWELVQKAIKAIHTDARLVDRESMSWAMQTARDVFMACSCTLCREWEGEPLIGIVS
ncbi:hypothetical protein SISNIDRAFT_483142 [Sistotremastrum niveocremeum HHB9708]|uniref:Uncharacterized protein n=1 Tax=Sistotremastrum niveocremeum HHB9708 TaxID=1314777 RepID=A0A164Y539_9AGAM|nr:hypothetical protein SISNIDRAFT_483142 [Sistotremastrum niveocremeum HHB9708]